MTPSAVSRASSLPESIWIGTPVIASTAATNSGPFDASRGAAVASTWISATPIWSAQRLEAAHRGQRRGDRRRVEPARRLEPAGQAAQLLLVEQRRRRARQALVDDQPHRVRPDVDDRDRARAVQPAGRLLGLRGQRRFVRFRSGLGGSVLRDFPRPDRLGLVMKYWCTLNGDSPFLTHDAFRTAVRQDRPALLVVGKVGDHDLAENLLVHRRIEDRHHRLDPPVEVARHHVGRADIDQRLRRRQAVAVAEAEDAGVLEEAADDRLDPDVLGKPRNARPQAADAADHQIDLHAGDAGVVERVDDGRIDQRVHLHPDAPPAGRPWHARPRRRSGRGCGRRSMVGEIAIRSSSSGSA